MNIIKSLIKNPECGYFTHNFYKDSKPLAYSPEWGMTLLSAGTMKFRWNEENANRKKMIKKLSNKKKTASVELIHSKIIYEIENTEQLKELQGDGIITKQQEIMPAVTVADCMPIYIYETKSQIFGVLHSGWKGTGILKNAIDILKEKYNSQNNDICIAIGPHIHSECYIVDQERAEYFSKNFTQKSVTEADIRTSKIKWKNTTEKLYHLSLLEANLNIIEKENIPMGNLVIADDCTCCNELYGSNRRQSAEGKDFTPQLAFVRWK